jgi:hypothetical protein
MSQRWRLLWLQPRGPAELAEEAAREAQAAFGDRLEVHILQDGQLASWVEAIRRIQPDIIEICGEDEPGGYLVLETGEGGQMNPRGLARGVQDMASPPLLALVNACNSDGLAERLQRSMPAAIGMNGMVSEEGWRAFRRGLYLALGEGIGVDEATGWGRSRLQEVYFGKEADLPVLHPRFCERRLRDLA